VVAPLVDLGACLAGDEWSTAEGAHRVAGSGAFDSVPLPGLPPQQEDGDAGQEAAEEAAQEAGLAQVVSIPLDEEAWDARTAQADFAVAETTTDSLFPFLRHVGAGVGGVLLELGFSKITCIIFVQFKK